jgi:D-sedoheptulose 7-phosphate isomerase
LSANAKMQNYLNLIVAGMDVDGAVRLIEVLEHANDADATVFVLGNGGSGAVAAHWVTDLGVNTIVPNRTGYRVVSLGDSPSSLTAVGNDIEFSEVFVTQLRAGLRPGDVVIALSVSGTSLNVVRAIEYANEVGAITVAMTGMDGGKLKTLADISIHTESTTDEYGPMEDMFSVFMHVVTGYIAQRRGRVLHH